MNDTLAFWAVGLAGLYLAYRVLRKQFSRGSACESCCSREQCEESVPGERAPRESSPAKRRPGKRSSRKRREA